MATLSEIVEDAGHRMDQAVEKVSQDFATIRTGRANPQILNNITVDYYGNPTPLNQLANFSVPEPRMLVINPYDKSSIEDIEKAIRDSDLGLNPATDGAIVRCVFPELTEERRKEYIKLAKQYAEDGKIAIRNVRRHARDQMQELEDEGEVGQDEHERFEKQLEEKTSEHVKRIDELLEHKEEELLEV
ncbi:MAG: ribosome recycling factor [Nitriliruptorales bacterium]|nr:ribosome recycling factor [Nitriliruptorales bacterium]